MIRISPSFRNGARKYGSIVLKSLRGKMPKDEKGQKTL